MGKPPVKVYPNNIHVALFFKTKYPNLLSKCSEYYLIAIATLSAMWLAIRFGIKFVLSLY